MICTGFDLWLGEGPLFSLDIFSIISKLNSSINMHNADTRMSKDSQVAQINWRIYDLPVHKWYICSYFETSIPIITIPIIAMKLSQEIDWQCLCKQPQILLLAVAYQQQSILTHIRISCIICGCTIVAIILVIQNWVDSPTQLFLSLNLSCYA